MGHEHTIYTAVHKERGLEPQVAHALQSYGYCLEMLNSHGHAKGCQVQAFSKQLQLMYRIIHMARQELQELTCFCGMMIWALGALLVLGMG